MRAWVEHEWLDDGSRLFMLLLSTDEQLLILLEEERGMASSGFGFPEEKMSEHETSDVSPEKLKRNLIQITIGKTTSYSDEKRIGIKRKSRSDEGQAIHQKSAAAASEMIVSRKKRSRPLSGSSSASVQDGNALEHAGRYQVKASLAHIHRSIFAKYGDIASKNSFKNFPEFATTLLEIVYDVVKKLQSSHFGAIVSELNCMMTLVEVAGMGKLDVSWLQKHLAEINEVRNLAIKATTKGFYESKMIMMMAKKRFKEVQRCFDDLIEVKNDQEF